MILKICLLITDDPDDHQAFSEAISDISSKTIVLIVLDSEKALELLKAKQLIPQFLFLDLSMNGMRINSFLKGIQNDVNLRSVPTVVYGDIAGFQKIEYPEKVVFFNKDYEYSELRNFLKEFIKPTTETQ